ncbi:oleate hydratase [Roseiarcus fermentans]|uniref:Oleate hydratase n=1 Tax=Roseiarcus fermentans TaxID=1473586 RepID=A0A366FIG6_9HYPH|nr:oleate hydratase [Roseiarcus fermentans]RBP14377.1 oleate hydratase [Roseiarcus fermentans]
MKAHIVGGGFGGLAAAVLLVRNAGISGPDITIYEAGDVLGGGLYLQGTAQRGYNLPGSVFDREFRCAFDLLAGIPAAKTPAMSVTDEFFAFNDAEPFDDRGRIVDRDGRLVAHDPRFGLTLGDFLRLARVALTPEAWLAGRRIDAFFPEAFFASEFWLLWSTLMGSLPQHGAVEFRRYLNRFLYLFPNLSDMTHILRTPYCQKQAFVEPMAAWLHPLGVNVLTGAVVTDLAFAPATERITVVGLEVERAGAAYPIAVAPEDLVLVTTGSQAACMSVGSMTEAPKPPGGGAAALWRRLAERRAGFGNPDVWFAADKAADSRWVAFTVTTTGTDFQDSLARLTGSKSGSGGLVTLRDAPWVPSVTVFHNPEVLGQPQDATVWWGYGLYPDRPGGHVRKAMTECAGAEILEEVVRQFGFDGRLAAIMRTSTCVPCCLPFVNNIWLPRKGGDRPAVVPEGSSNLGLIGQYVETPRDIAFTIEYSARTAWEAIHRLTGRGPAPPPVYQSQLDPKALLAALGVILGR